jgi:hypothetical protein
MTKAITLQNLRNPDFLQFLKDLSAIILANDPAALKVTDQYNAVQLVRKTLEQLFMPERSSAITEDIIALDLRRDNAINGIIGLAQSYTYHFDGNTRTAASMLSNYFGTYGAGIARENYTSETAILTNIVTDLHNKPNLSAAIATLQLLDWVTELDTANQAFNQKYLQRTQELAAASADTMRAKRSEAANAYYDLRNNLDAYFTITKGAGPFATAINEVNALIDQYNKLITGRSGGDAPTPTLAVPPVV